MKGIHKKFAEEKRKELEAIKPFRLVKYLSITSLSVILLSAFILSGFIAKGVKNIVLRKSEAYALLVAENLNHQVFYQFTLPTLITEGEVRLSNKSQYERLDRVVKNTIHGFSVDKVNIYDIQENLTYSTEESEELGKKKPLGSFHKKALEGETISVFEGGLSFIGFEWPWGRESHKLKTYIPMWIEKPMTWKRGKIIGVFEIIQDVTGDYETIFRFQWIVIGAFTIFVGFLLSALFLIAKRADRIIEKRGEERMKLREKLSRAEHLATLGEMIASVSHEIKNPLGIIQSTAQLVQKRLHEDKQLRLIKIIIEESVRLNNIVTEFLDFARPKEPQFANLRLKETLDESLKLIERQCIEKQVTIRKLYRYGQNENQEKAEFIHTSPPPSDDIVIVGDIFLLHRAFYNIFLNGLQAMQNGGILSVDVFANDKFAKVIISDTGCGISEEVKDKIFRPFFTTKDKGTGLGLAIVYAVVESHKGEVTVESEPGKGTSITLKLPIKSPSSS